MKGEVEVKKWGKAVVIGVVVLMALMLLLPEVHLIRGVAWNYESSTTGYEVLAIYSPWVVETQAWIDEDPGDAVTNLWHRRNTIYPKAGREFKTLYIGRNEFERGEPVQNLSLRWTFRFINLRRTCGVEIVWGGEAN